MIRARKCSGHEHAALMLAGTLDEEHRHGSPSGSSEPTPYIEGNRGGVEPPKGPSKLFILARHWGDAFSKPP
jgi:hypothetical protein